jgi:Tol biopolymer transport system component
MTFAPGTRLGPYEIVAPVGAGGMGEVYRATDPRLGRQVAVKVLPAEFAADPDRLSRFEQEARAAAALNHPHIAAVFDIGTDGAVRYIVQELLEGESLRARLAARHDRPLGEWLPIAVEIASALAAAHQAGVVHRDIKPENVMISPDGRAKVLDFGLAKLVEPGGAGAVNANSPTSLGTIAGTVMGTAGYLAPEQAAGLAVDRRADIFSLGCILYEMASGEQPFAGRSGAETIAHILHDEPRPLLELKAQVPAEFQRIVTKCLAKDPAKRYQHADDLALDLRDLAARPVAPAPLPVQASATRRAGAARWLWPAIAVLVAGFGAWGWLRPTPTAPAQPPSRLAVIVPNYGGSATGIQRRVAITPDGSTLLFPTVTPDGSERTMSLRLDETAPSPVPGVESYLGDYVMGPNGREFIGTVGATGQVFRYSMTGGDRKPLPREVSGSGFVAWGEDGTLWFTGLSAPVLRLAPDGTITRPFGRETSNLALMQMLPGDRAAIGIRAPSGTASGPAVVVDLRTGSASTLINRDVVEVRYTAGYLVHVLADGSLNATGFDPARGLVDDDTVTLATGVSLTGNASAQMAVAANGTVAYIPENPRSLVLINRDGTSREATTEKRNFHAPMFSPDGRRIVFDFNSADGRDVWVLGLSDGILSRATFDRDGHDAVWTPDGSALTYASVKDGVLSVLRVQPGVPQPRVLFGGPKLGYGGVWLPDGSGLVTVANELDAGTGSDLAWLRDAGKGPLEPLLATRFEEAYPAVSPDGRWLAFVSNQSGQNQVYVRPLKGQADQVQVSVSGGSEPMWSRDGRELFYRTGAGPGAELVQVAFRTDPAFSVTARRALFSVAEMVNSTPHRNYDVSPDGKTFVMVRFNPSTRIMVIQNLPALVERAKRGTR